MDRVIIILQTLLPTLCVLLKRSSHPTHLCILPSTNLHDDTVRLGLRVKQCHFLLPLHPPCSTNQINICTLRVSEYNTDCEMRTTFCKCSGCSVVVVVVESSRVELCSEGEEAEGGKGKGLAAVVVVRGFHINSDFINYFARVVVLALLPPFPLYRTRLPWSQLFPWQLHRLNERPNARPAASSCAMVKDWIILFINDQRVCSVCAANQQRG